MKKILTYLFLCLLSLCTYAEGEFSKDSIQWIIRYHWEEGKHMDVWRNTYFTYQLLGDTLIDNQTFKKLYLDDRFHGAIREENQKVWYYSCENNLDENCKLLLYDFSKEKGEVIHFDYTTYLDVTSLFISKEPYTLTVLDVDYKFGRKVMHLSNHDTWIEGIGSIYGFWGIDLQHPTNYSNRDVILKQVVANRTSIYMAEQIVDPDYKGTFLTEGKTWYVDDTEKFKRIRLDAPVFHDYYIKYPLILEGEYDMPLIYLYDVNGNIYCYYEDEMFLYNFNLSEGDRVRLYLSYGNLPYMHIPPRTEEYTVNKVDSIESDGKKLKRIFLEGSLPYVWIEGVGSTYHPLYIPRYAGSRDKPKTVVTCCYDDEEFIYHNPDYPDCESRPSMISYPIIRDLYTFINGNLVIRNHADYQLIIYDMTGRPIYSRLIQNSEEVIPLKTVSTPVLIGKLVNQDNSITFKIHCH